MNIKRYDREGFARGGDNYDGMVANQSGSWMHCDDHEQVVAELTKARAEISHLEAIIADFWTQAEKTNSAFNFYLRKERDTLRADYSALREKHDKLSTENAPLRADAERYRWLRDTGDATWRPFGIREGSSAIKADKAIDAAIASRAQAEKGTQ